MAKVCSLLIILHLISTPFVRSTTISSVFTDPAYVMQHMTNLELALATVQTQLQITREEQKSTSDELLSIKAELRLAQSDILETESRLKQIETEHNLTLTEQSSTLHELESVKSELRWSESSLNSVKSKMKLLEEEHNDTVNELNSLKNKFDTTHDGQVKLQTEFDMLKSDSQTAERDLAVVKFKAEQHAADIGQLSTDVAHLKTEIENKDSSNGSSQSSVDKATLASIHVDVRSNIAEISLLKYRLDSTDKEITTTHTQVQNLQSKIHSFQTNVTTELKHIEARQPSTSGPDSNLGSQINSISAEVKDLRDRFVTVERTLLNTTYDLNLLESDFTTFRYNETACRGNRSSNIGFEVRLQMHQTTVHMGSKLMFDTVEFNNGGGYGESTGIFTAPEGGSYFFWAHVMMAQANSMMELFFMKNGLAVAKSYTETPPDQVYGIVTFTSVIHVAKDDIVWFQKNKGTDNIYGELYSGYGGVLIARD